MSNLEHERFVESWLENNSEIDSGNEELARFFKDNETYYQMFQIQFSERLIERKVYGVSLDNLDNETYEQFLRWFESDPSKVKIWNDWLIDRIPDAPEEEFDTTEEANGLR